MAAGRYGHQAQPWPSCLCFGRLQSDLKCWAVDKFLLPKAQKVVGFRTKKFALGKIRVASVTPPAPGERAGKYTGPDLRRSRRSHRAVRLMILGRDCEGQPYRETMSTVTLNLHGCCYQSWHNSQIGAIVALRLTEGLMDKSPSVRARVRYVRPPMSHTELFQVGVEFDTPPREWLSLPVETTWEHPREAELTLKPETTSAAQGANPQAAQPLAIAQEEFAVAERLTITIDKLVAELQGPLQRAAENAMEAGRAQLEETVKRTLQRDLTTKLDEAVRQLRCMIDEISRANARQAESLLLQRLEQTMRTSKQEISRQVDARLEELFASWEEQREH